jgi:hypothetical protein
MALQVDALVGVEALVLDRQDGVDDVLGHLGQLERLAILGLEDVDDIAGGVVHHRPLGQGGERRQVGRLGVIGRHDLHDLRHDSDADRRQAEAGDEHGDGEPYERSHVVPRVVAGRGREGVIGGG